MDPAATLNKQLSEAEAARAQAEALLTEAREEADTRQAQLTVIEADLADREGLIGTAQHAIAERETQLSHALSRADALAARLRQLEAEQVEMNAALAARMSGAVSTTRRWKHCDRLAQMRSELVVRSESCWRRRHGQRN